MSIRSEEVLSADLSTTGSAVRARWVYNSLVDCDGLSFIPSLRRWALGLADDKGGADFPLTINFLYISCNKNS